MRYVWNHLQTMWQQLWQGDVQAIIFWGALYCGVVGGVSLMYLLRIRSWPMTQGELEQVGVERWGGPEWAKSEQQYKLHALYRYRVDGRVFEGHRVSAWVIVTSHNALGLLQAQRKGVQRNPDGTVSVYYNPKRPHKSYLIRPGLPGLLITLCIIAGPMLYYWCRFHGA